MQDRTTHGSSCEIDVWVWITLAGLLVVGVLIAFGSMAIMSNNQQMQTQTGTAPAPAVAPAK